MTYAQAINNGCKLGHRAYTRGYISRKSDINNLPVQKTKTGKLYVDMPCWESTQYCIRQYLIAL